MNIGAICILAAFGAAGASLAAYLIAWSGNDSARRIARALFALMTACLALASVLLMGAILNDDFSISYVANYSSRTLPFLYKISAFWGGQEGTILLWALLQGLTGLFVIKREDEWELSVMSFLMIPQLLLMLLLVRVRPFQAQPPPPDGAGLNPLLQDPWMAIHPPIVFIGFAALVVPFAFALAAASRGKADAWVPKVLPWALVSVVTLGLGLFLGGFWAYKVLGWGGYWGWDPVENSSLGPWLVGSALVHGLLTQRATGALKRTNLVLAALSYILVLYSTYLTRSGVLANFSVHSFAEGGINALLIGTMAVCTLVPASLIALRWRTIQGPRLNLTLSLPAAMVIGILLILMFTALLVVGTSWPILSGLLGQPASPGPGFYNRTSLPIGVLIAAVLIAAPLMGWLPSTWPRLLRQTAPGLVLGLLAAIIPLAAGLRPKGGSLVLVLLAASVAALTACLIRVARQVRTNPLMTGAGIAHAGLALMLVGIVTTSSFDRTESASLPAGQPQKVLGHDMTLRRYVFEPDSRREPHFEIDVVPQEGTPYLATPIMFRWAQRDQVIARPHISRSLLGDVYIAPVNSVGAKGPAESLFLDKDKAQSWGSYTFTFRRFQAHSADEGGMSVGALVDVTRDGRTEPVTFVLTVGPSGPESEAIPLPFGDGVTGRLEGMQVENGRIHVVVEDPSAPSSPEILNVDVSYKPLINLLWLGIALMAGGSGLAVWQRARDANALAAAPAGQTGKIGVSREARIAARGRRR